MRNFRRFLILGAVLVAIHAQDKPKSPPLTEREKALNERVVHLRSLPDDAWTKEVGELAREIQQLQFSTGKQSLVDGLSMQVTEGDAGSTTLQVVADTIVQVVSALPANRSDFLADRLARLARYEHVKVASNNPHYLAAMAKLEAGDQDRQAVEFTLSDLKGRKWTLRDLRGKVVLVNFWATWCPPCRREMPDMQALYERFSPQGLVILAISNEAAGTVEPFIAAQKYSYPILLDPEGAVGKRFDAEGIPQSFVYNRDGKLVAQAMDRRTLGQFLGMLKRAGLE